MSSFILRSETSLKTRNLFAVLTFCYFWVKPKVEIEIKFILDRFKHNKIQILKFLLYVFYTDELLILYQKNITFETTNKLSKHYDCNYRSSRVYW